MLIFLADSRSQLEATIGASESDALTMRPASCKVRRRQSRSRRFGQEVSQERLYATTVTGLWRRFRVEKAAEAWSETLVIDLFIYMLCSPIFEIARPFSVIRQRESFHIIILMLGLRDRTAML